MSLEKAKEKAAAIKAEAEKMAESTPPLPELTKAPEVESKNEAKATDLNGTKPSTETPIVSSKPENEWPTVKSDYALSINAFPFLDDDSSISDDDVAPRVSTQISRPTTSDRYASSLYESLYKPKAKVGPRPSMDTRPNTAKSARGIASLPAGMRASRPGSTIQLRPKSRDSHMTTIHLPPPPPIPEMPTTLEIPRPRSSAGSVKSLPATLPKSSSMTPEKARLKRYQEMYKRKEKERARQSALPAVPALPPMLHTLPMAIKATSTSKCSETTQPKDTALAESLPEEAPLSPVDHTKSDSGVGMDDSPTEKPNTVETTVEKTCKDPASGNVEPDVDHHTPEASTIEQPQRRPSTEEPSSMHSISSPTSLQDSSGRTSTRPTSVSDDSLNEKATPPTDVNEEEQVDTPSTIVQEKLNSAPNVSETVAAASSALGAETLSDSVGSLDLPIQAPLSQDTDTIDEKMKVETPLTPSADESDFVNDHKAKRRGIVPPLDLSTTNSEVDYDDEFMDELRDAEVVQARSMSVSVSKSPITPFFPRRTSIRKSSTSSTEQTPTIINTKIRSSSPSPDTSFARSPSGSRLSSLTLQGEAMVAAKPTKIQTGIASKIADLQRSFSRGSAIGTPPSNKTPEGVKSSLSQRGFPFNNRPSPSPFADRPGSKASFSSVETASPITRPRAASNLSSRISLYNNPPQENPKKEVMEVRATIVRTDRTSKIQPLPPTADTPLELYESPLVINHQRAQSVSVPEARSYPKRQSSLPMPAHPVKQDSATTPNVPLSPISDKADRESVTGSTRRSMEGAWRSLGRRMSRSESKKADSSQPASPTTGPLPRSMSNSSLETADSRSDSQSTKVGSRASRLMRRMSSSMSSIASVGKLPLSPRHGASRGEAAHTLGSADHDRAPSIAEVSEPAPRPPALDVGDLNVQFPDTLLWKRRWVEIDAAGFVVLRPLEMGGAAAGAAGAAAKSAMVKKYHLSDFREPFMPDMERQEMPWSVVCDFKDGRCLQFGTGSGAGQAGLLRCKFSSP